MIVSKSRFLGYCLPVINEAAAQEALARLRKQHYNARHCCYAYRLLDGIERSSDDGEPSGTAGAPILNVLAGAQTENAMIAVVRYFGGVLLGTGGLARAYGKAASIALQASACVRMRVCAGLGVVMPYSAYSMLEPLIRAKRYPCKAAFGESVSLTLLIPEEEADAFLKVVTEKTYGGASFERLGRSLEAVSEPVTSTDCSYRD